MTSLEIHSSRLEIRPLHEHSRYAAMIAFSWWSWWRVVTKGPKPNCIIIHYQLDIDNRHRHELRFKGESKNIHTTPEPTILQLRTEIPRKTSAANCMLECRSRRVNGEITSSSPDSAQSSDSWSTHRGCKHQNCVIIIVRWNFSITFRMLKNQKQTRWKQPLHWLHRIPTSRASTP